MSRVSPSSSPLFAGTSPLGVVAGATPISSPLDSALAGLSAESASVPEALVPGVRGANVLTGAGVAVRTLGIGDDGERGMTLDSIRSWLSDETDRDLRSLQRNDEGVGERISRVRQNVRIVLGNESAQIPLSEGEVVVVQEVASSLREADQTTTPKKVAQILVQAAPRLPLHFDVNAFVRAVLLQSYMFDQQLLFDKSEKMRLLNEERKGKYEQLKTLRALRSKVSSGEDLTSDERDFLDDGDREHGDGDREGDPLTAHTLHSRVGDRVERELGGFAVSGLHRSAASGVLGNDTATGRPSPGLGSSDGADSRSESAKLGAQIDAAIETLEGEIETMGFDAQLWNQELQELLQRQQRTLQMMSNVSKMLHDTAMSVIRTIAG